MNRFLTVIVIAFTASLCARAQDYRYEVGPALGVSGYLGDVNKSNFMKHPGLAGGAVFRYIMNYRWALKADFFAAGISGNSEDGQSKFPQGQNYSFSSKLYDFGAQMEFNFFDFGIGATYLKLRRLTPYMVIGIGGTVASASGSTAFAMNIPLGVGFKFKLKERINLGLEFTMRKAFGDKIDGLSDLNGIPSSFAKNTDWYALTMFTLTYEFSKRCKVCHYVE